jgi:phage/plasmid primase, P4 family, C-terminal domain|nr:MAG TPA: dsDNA helicase [Caudoviricetes sp.]
MRKFHISTANCIWDSSNCIYPNNTEVANRDSFIKAISFDHVCGIFKGSYRSKDNFILSDCIPMDCDNDHSDDEKDWVTPFDVAMAFPDVCFYASYSRNHMKGKAGKSARPRFHVYFPIDETEDADEYANYKVQIQSEFPYFDNNALDAARFLYGILNPEVDLYEGKFSIIDFLQEDAFANLDEKKIESGSRNNTMSHIAGKLIKRFGATDESYQKFMEQADRCDPPLSDGELSTIWNSAKKFGDKVSNQEGYIPPEQYNLELELMPEDFSDVGQATILAREYGDKLRYSPATDFLVYNGSFWEESQPNAQGIAQELTARQLEEAEVEIQKAITEMNSNGAWALIAAMGPKKASAQFNKEQARSFEKYEQAEVYRKYAIKRRDTKYISAALKEVRPMVQVEQSMLDADEFMLNTPYETINLVTGECLDHKSEDYITKQTTVFTGEEGEDIWLDALNTFFVDDIELISYVQKIVGLASIGKVYVEALIIAYGEGRNGKSTFWNVVSKVLGTYSGNMSADMLTVGCRRNVKPELAEAKGKRLLIAAELEEGMRMNTSNVKQLCSTDEIFAEKKFKSPFSYVPSHTLVLYTNHLPRVGAVDKGTWRRLIVIPFDAKIEGQNDIKNYTEYLFENAGGAILSWIIEGAKQVIKDEYHIDAPKRVQDAIAAYKENNDWMKHFLDECCEIDSTFTEKSGELYTAYRSYCLRTGEFTRSAGDFYSVLEIENFQKKKTKKGIIVYGLRLKSEFED